MNFRESQSLLTDAVPMALSMKASAMEGLVKELSERRASERSLVKRVPTSMMW